MKWISLCILILLTSACSVMTPTPYQNIQHYQLSKLPPKTAYHRQSRPTLLVALPGLDATLNTTQMAYIPKPYQVAYFSQNNWAALPNLMIQSAIINSLQNSGPYKAVVKSPYTGSYHYLLTSQVIELTQDFSSRQPVFKLKIKVNLLNNKQHKLIANKTFTIYQAISPKTPYAGVIAANKALEQFLKQLNHFCRYHR